MSCDCRHNFKIMMCLPVTYRYDWNTSNLYRGGVTNKNKDTDNDKSTGSDNKSKSFTPQISQSLRNTKSLMIRRGNRRIDFFAFQLSQTEPSK